MIRGEGPEGPEGPEGGRRDERFRDDTARAVNREDDVMKPGMTVTTINYYSTLVRYWYLTLHVTCDVLRTVGRYGVEYGETSGESKGFKTRRRMRR
jgi:hypothetical protein